MKYGKTIFIMVDPPAKVIKSFRPRNKREHESLINEARSKNFCLYYAVAQRRDGKYVSDGPWKLDEDSVTPKTNCVTTKLDKEPSKRKVQRSKPKQYEGKSVEYICQKCGKRLTSKSGYTLHVKAKHGL